MRFTKQLLLAAFIVVSSFYANAQNVGIGTTTPPYKLTIQTPTGNWGVVQTDGTVTLGSYISSGIGEFGTKSNHPFYLFSNNADNPPAITLDAGGINVGIGTTAPAYNLDVHSAGNAQFNLREGIGGQTALFSRYTNRLEIQPSDAFEISVGGIDKRNLCVAGNGGVGIGTSTPANLLQVGSYTNLNFAGNQLAFGFGTNVTVMNQYASYFNLQSSSAMNMQSANGIYLMPGNGSGNVGINTNAPIAPLDVEGYVNISSSDPGNAALSVSGTYTSYSVPSNNSLTHCSGFCPPFDLSILASGEIVAQAFYALSDARYKDIEDISNSAKDLQTLNAIQITDYTLKDKIVNGDRPYKKVIAQQVEEIYPQIVNKGVNYIPNIYQFTNKIEKTSNGYLLTFANKHNISKDATKIKLQDGTAMQQYNIIAIPSENQVVINGNQIKSDTAFVYGEQVNDFRTVDYDGLTTLNISATQELSKLVKQQQAEIDAQNAKIDELVAMVKKLEEKH